MEEGGETNVLGFFFLCPQRKRGKGLLIIVKVHQHPDIGDGYLMHYRP